RRAGGFLFIQGYKVIYSTPVHTSQVQAAIFLIFWQAAQNYGLIFASFCCKLVTAKTEGVHVAFAFTSDAGPAGPAAGAASRQQRGRPLCPVPNSVIFIATSNTRSNRASTPTSPWSRPRIHWWLCTGVPAIRCAGRWPA